MNKRNLFIFSCLMISGAIILIQKNSVRKEIDLNSAKAKIHRPDPLRINPGNKNPPTLITSSKNVKEETREPQSNSIDKSSFGKVKNNYIDNFELREVSHLGVKLVTNFAAVPPQKGSPGTFRGYDLIETQDQSLLNIVYDPETGAYGIWSREIIVRGSEEGLLTLQQELNLEQVGKAPGANIYRVPENFRLEDLYSGADTKINLDIQYSRVTTN